MIKTMKFKQVVFLINSLFLNIAKNALYVIINLLIVTFKISNSRIKKNNYFYLLVL